MKHTNYVSGRIFFSPLTITQNSFVRTAVAAKNNRAHYKTFSANASYAKALAVPEFFTKEQSVFIFDARVSF